MRIADILETGKENAQTGRDICNLLNITLRDLTLAIERERRAGFPICASSGKNPGYFLAADKEEMQTYCDSLRRRGGELFKTRRACIKSMDCLPGRSDTEQLNHPENGEVKHGHLSLMA